MRPFKYSKAGDAGAAITLVSANPGAKFLGGGTNLVDLMKEDVMHPLELVDVTRLKHADVEKTANGVTIGGTATNATTANHELIRKNYPLLSMAILAGASAQIRNMATNAGNLNQRTRCTYFYDVNMPCNKRQPGSGCGALKGINRNHAIFGWSEKCVAVYPSDMAVALAALNAVVHVEGKNSTKRTIEFADYHRLPGETPEKDNNLRPDEIITSIELPENDFADRSYYLKIRERSSYAFALVSVAATLSLDGNQIKQVRIALGGVAHKPWRASVAEKWLTGKEATEANFRAAAEAELKNARPLEHNKFKVAMARKAITRALQGAIRAECTDWKAGPKTECKSNILQQTTEQTMSETGKPISRIDGRMKVTGKATYAAEFNQPNMAYAFPVRATIAKGRITSIDDAAIKKEPGVLNVISYKNALKLKPLDMSAQAKAGAAFLGENLPPLQNNQVHYPGQFIAVVVAESYEQARAAAYKLKVRYAAEKAATDLKTELPTSKKPKMFMGDEAQVSEGKAAAPLAASAHRVDHAYSTPVEHHHPMEPHATVAVWEGTDKLTLYDATQGVVLTGAIAAYFLGLKQENVRVIAPFVGGGFGSKGLWLHTLLVAMAAKAAGRPVKLALTRQMMQTNVGHRAATIQHVALGTDTAGKLGVLRHHTDTYNNLTEFFEPSGKQSLVLYKAPLREVTYNVAKLNRGTPTFMRAPGETPGTFALESAMDEMAYQLKMDPIAFRIANHTSQDPMKGHDFSSEFLIDCYRIGAEKFGWSARNMEPRQKRVGKYLVGYGMATATYPGGRSAASVKVSMTASGDVTVMTASIDIGTGTYTVLAQTAADALSVPVNRIQVKIGDSSLPPAPLAGGSQTTASIHPAAMEACVLLRKDLAALAIADPASPLNGRKPEEIGYADGKLFIVGDEKKTDSYAAIISRAKRTEMEACATTQPVSGAGLTVPSALCTPQLIPAEQNSDDKHYAFHSFGAQFAEVWVDEDFGTIRVKRFTSVQDVGRIMNEKTARSQIIGGVIFGIGAALMEATEYDKRWGNPVVRTLADYHVPVNLDVPPIDVHFIGKPDPHISPIGARGIGEIGITGVAAAIANAVFNATGKRLRDLPMTPDKLV